MGIPGLHLYLAADKEADSESSNKANADGSEPVLLVCMLR